MRKSMVYGGLTLLSLASVALVAYLLIYPSYKVRRLLDMAGSRSTVFKELSSELADVWKVRPDLASYLRNKVSQGDIDVLEKTAELLRRFPGLGLYNCDVVDAEQEGPAYQTAADGQCEELLLLYLDLLTCRAPSEARRLDRVHAIALELFSSWTSAPRQMLTWSGLPVDEIPNTRSLGSPGKSLDQVAAALPQNKLLLERCVRELKGWIDEGHDKVVFGKIVFGSDGLPAVNDPREPFIGTGMRVAFCRLAEQIRPRQIGKPPPDTPR